MKPQYPNSRTSRWVGPLRWVPRWFDTSNPTPVHNDYELNYPGYESFSVSSYYGSGFMLSKTTDSLSATGNYGLLEPIAYQINLIRLISQYIRDTQFFSYSKALPTKVFLIDGDPSTIRVKFTTGLVEIPEVESISEAMLSGQTCWYKENELAVVFGMGLSETGAYQQGEDWYFDYEQIDPNKVYYIQHRNNRWVPYHPNTLAPDSRLPVQEADKLRFYLDIFPNYSWEFEVDGIIRMIEGFDLTDPTDESMIIYCMPEEDQSVIADRIDALRVYLRDQSIESVNVGISASLGLFTLNTVTSGDTIGATDVLRGKRFVSEYFNPHDKRINRPSPVEVIGFTKRRAKKLEITNGEFTDNEVLLASILTDRKINPYEGPDTNSITPTSTTTNTRTIAGKFKWQHEFTDISPLGDGTFL